MLESFFFNDTATTEIYTLSLHDALPIFALVAHLLSFDDGIGDTRGEEADGAQRVVVAGDDVVDAFGRAVGVDDGDHGYPEAVRLGDGDLFLAHVDDEERVGQAVFVFYGRGGFLRSGEQTSSHQSRQNLLFRLF